MFAPPVFTIYPTVPGSQKSFSEFFVLGVAHRGKWSAHKRLQL
jgi:hypothetical protein